MQHFNFKKTAFIEHRLMLKKALTQMKTVQTISQYLLSERLRILNFGDELQTIEQGWSNVTDQQRQITNVLSIKVLYCGDLVESWTIINLHKETCPQILESVFDELMNDLRRLVEELIKDDYQIQDLTHILLFNESHKVDWARPEDLQVQQIKKSENNFTISVSVAYVPKRLYQREKSKIRQRFMSYNEVIPQTKQISGRKTSHDLETRKISDQSSSTKESSGSHTQRSRLVSMYSKKDDVEILSSPEDYDKILVDQKEEDFEIHMIIIEQELKQILLDQKKKLTKNSAQIAKLYDYVSHF